VDCEGDGMIKAKQYYWRTQTGRLQNTATSDLECQAIIEKQLAENRISVELASKTSDGRTVDGIVVAKSVETSDLKEAQKEVQNDLARI